MSRQSAGRPIVIRRLAVEVVLWWAMAYAVWLLSLSTVPLQELLLAAACALPCGLIAAGARWAIRDSWWVRAGWLKPLLVLPIAIVTDAAQVLYLALRPRPVGGRFATIASGAAGDTSTDRGRQALVVGMVSATPGTYVLDIDPRSGEMLTHALASRGPRMEKLAVPSPAGEGQ